MLCLYAVLRKRWDGAYNKGSGEQGRNKDPTTKRWGWEVYKNRLWRSELDANIQALRASELNGSDTFRVQHVFISTAQLTQQQTPTHIAWQTCP